MLEESVTRGRKQKKNEGKGGVLRKSLKDVQPGRGVWFAFWKDSLPVVWAMVGQVARWKWAKQGRQESRPGMR